jgi:hypothetical protein
MRTSNKVLSLEKTFKGLSLGFIKKDLFKIFSLNKKIRI